MSFVLPRGKILISGCVEIGFDFTIGYYGHGLPPGGSCRRKRLKEPASIFAELSRELRWARKSSSDFLKSEERDRVLAKVEGFATRALPQSPCGDSSLPEGAHLTAWIEQNKKECLKALGFQAFFFVIP